MSDEWESQVRSLRPIPLLLLLVTFIGVHSACEEPVELRRNVQNVEILIGSYAYTTLPLR